MEVSGNGGCWWQMVLMVIDCVSIVVVGWLVLVIVIATAVVSRLNVLLTIHHSISV
jgi:hypothetical protein